LGEGDLGKVMGRRKLPGKVVPQEVIYKLIIEMSTLGRLRQEDHKFEEIYVAK
jgi:hypothetical protein